MAAPHTRPSPRRPGQQLYRKNRFNAPEICAEREWGIGTEIASDKWTGTRVIKHIGPAEIEVSYGKTSKRQFCKTLPDDVRAV